MTRCDYDGVFYRVFCVTLLATAFTFTVILTNVFIDIDGLLSRRAKQSHGIEQNGNYETTTDTPYKITEENMDKNDIDDKAGTAFRTKRSLDTTNFLSHIKTNKIKKIFNTRLAKLLERLDKQESDDEDIFNAAKTTTDFDSNEKSLDEETLDIKQNKEHVNDYNGNGTKKNPLPPNVQNILQGIIGHLYEKNDHAQSNKLLNNLNNVNLKGNKTEEQQIHLYRKIQKDAENKHLKKIKNIVEPKENAIGSLSKSKITTKSMSSSLFRKEEKFIKTKLGKRNSNLHNMPENFGIGIAPEKTKWTHEYKYQNDPIDLNFLEKYIQPYKDDKLNTFSIGESKVNLILKLKEWDEQYRNKQLRKVIDDYKQNNGSYQSSQSLKKNSIHQFELFTGSTQRNQMNRLKRHIKVRYDDYEASTKRLKPVRKGLKKTDDDLYVEIETHFNGKGVKGERKKKLVRNLIDRIQKAIRSDVDPQDEGNQVNKINQHSQIKKRVQNPLKHKYEQTLSNYNSVEHRKMNPINVILPLKDLSRDLENLEEQYSAYDNPNIPAMSNLDKSFEITNSDADINNVLSSGIPQRFQMPLNPEEIKAGVKSQNTYADTGNVTLFIKDIDGSGFSVGFNQYMDEPPDVESMKIFSGLENVIQSYHDNYDQNAGGNYIDNSAERQHELKKRNVHYNQNEHVLLRRSVHEVNNEDYHSNAYKIVFDKKVLPYENYQDILETPSKSPVSSNYEYKLRNYNYNPKNIKIITKDIKIKALPLVLDDDIFEKKLKPSEIFGLASLLLNNRNNRKKRSINVQRITNLKSRIKLNRYLNTKAMQSKTVFLKNKRNKRQIDKIRIIASDHLHHRPKTSDENIFVVSGENLFTNRAMLREIELPESDTGDERGGEHSEDTLPYTFEETNLEESYPTNTFDTKYRHNTLMSKYPHIFTDSNTNSKEGQIGNENEYYVSESNKPSLGLENLLGMRGTSENMASSEKDVPEIVDAIMPSPSKTGYKVTVKILPKNLTNPPSGFKEMHTVINKTYNNNGVQYYSLVNVSEISKIEKINKTKENFNQPAVKEDTTANIQEREDKMKLFIALQKEKIEQQLQHLNNEKNNLESILRERDGIKERNLSDLLKEIIHVESQKKNDALHFVRDPSISHLRSQHLTAIEQTTAATSIAPTTNVEHVSTPKLKPKTDVVKTKVETSIKENENFTNEILSRINKNTDILQSFLKQLIEKLEPTPRQQTTTQHAKVEHITEEANHLRPHTDLSKDWGLNLNHMHDTFFSDHNPHKNDSHYAIPFVYAYQHPYIPNKSPLPMAKVVYHGHIHTSAIHKHANDNWKYNANNPKLVHNAGDAKHDNATRFFMDTMARNAPHIPPKITENLDFNHNCSATIKIH